MNTRERLLATMRFELGIVAPKREFGYWGLSSKADTCMDSITLHPLVMRFKLAQIGSSNHKAW